MEQRCSDAVLCNPCAAGHFDSTRKKTMLIFADYTFRGWPLIREKRESLVPRKFRSIRYVCVQTYTHTLNNNTFLITCGECVLTDYSVDTHTQTHTHTHTHTHTMLNSKLFLSAFTFLITCGECCYHNNACPYKDMYRCCLGQRVMI